MPGCENAFGGKRSVWRAGYTVGAGVEGHLYKNWSLRAEYRYLHFNINRDQSSSDNITTVTQTATATSTNPTESSLTRTQETKFDFHLGKVGIAYRFCNCD